MLLKDLSPGPNSTGVAQNLNIQNILGQPGLNNLGRGDPLQGLMMPNLMGGVNQDPFGLGIGIPGF